MLLEEPEYDADKRTYYYIIYRQVHFPTVQKKIENELSAAGLHGFIWREVRTDDKNYYHYKVTGFEKLISEKPSVLSSIKIVAIAIIAIVFLLIIRRFKS